MSGMSWAAKALVLPLVLMVSGCAVLPFSGPFGFSVVNQAETSAEEGPTEKLPYIMLDLNKRMVARLQRPRTVSLAASFGLKQGRPPMTQIGTGDVVQLTIFESAAGGLFVPSDAGARPGNFVQLPQQAVDSSGSILVPYAGKVRIEGRSIESITSEIEQRLANRAIEPKVILNLVSQRAYEVTVIGDVHAPNKITIGPSGDRILDAIARVGGANSPPFDTTVTLTRGGKSVTVPMPALTARPRENIFMLAGDVLQITKKPRTFVALGATGITTAVGSSVNSMFSFDAENISLAQGLARAGGLNDGRADPSQVFVYRYEDTAFLRSIGANLSAFDPADTQVPVVYRADYSSPAAFFLANQFQLADHDVIFIANSGAVDYLKVLSLIASTTGTYTGVRNLR